MKSTHLLTCLGFSVLITALMIHVAADPDNMAACQKTFLPLYLRQVCATATSEIRGDEAQPSKSTIRDVVPPRRRPINPAIRFGKRSKKTPDYLTVKIFRIFNYIYSNIFHEKKEE
ncbi:uncharacterized protein LOC100370914 [Saccoglossus kowalevskii]|uniref:Uncharacterized protein LOC100370914 n=1 Tax=Saccoglossus kowalevskii TaxID=10224 RepID=A0ABM0GTJ5_SACKO|nr:PREDICTED: uncharacterized protein LOC100370914 [Saccoglossus kowalevskii]